MVSDASTVLPSATGIPGSSPGRTTLRSPPGMPRMESRRPSRLTTLRDPSIFCGCFGGITLLSLSKLLSSSLASFRSNLVRCGRSGLAVDGTTTALGPALAKLGRRYLPAIEDPKVVCPVAARIVDASDVDSSSSLFSNGSSSGSSSKSLAIDASAMGDPAANDPR